MSLPFVQTRLAREVTSSLNEEYGTNIFIDKFRVSLISWETVMQDIYVEDYKKDTLFSIGELSTSILNLKNLRDGRLEFGDIEVDDLNFILKTYVGETDTNLDVFIDKLDDGTPRDPGTPPFYLSSSNINVKSGSFKYIDENLETQKVLDFRKLAISANDFLIVGPEVGMDVQNMAFMSSRGIPVERMHTRFQYSKERMQFDSLLIQTPKSRVKGMLKFMYDRKDFSDFVDKVQLQAQFNEASVSSDELNLYYDEFGSGKVFDLASGFSGTLNDLVADVDFLQTEDTGIRGTFNFKNLFSDEAPFFMGANMRNVTTSYYELRGLLPRLLGTNLPLTLSKFGQFTVRGNADVTETSVNAKVNIATALGTSYADLQLNNVDDNDEVTYKGFVSLMDFDLARLLDNQKLGKTTMDVNVEGNGFVRERLNTEVIGKVYTIGFNGYTYKDLNVSGIIKDQLFDGSLMANDENVKFDFKGLVDFAEERNNFNFVADVAYADLKKLNFINDSVSIFKGHIDMDASGNTLDDLVGEVRFRRTSFQNKNDTYYFNDFEVTSSFENDSLRTIQINSPDIITGFVTGNFKVGELGRLVQNSIGTIYTNYSPYKISSGQRLNFNFNIYNKIVDVFFPEVKFDPNTFIRGKIVADEGDFKLSFKSPSIAAYGTQADAIELQIDNKNPLFNTFMSVGDLSTPYYDVKDFNLINTTLKDTLFFRTEFKGGSEYNDSYNLNFYHTFNKDNKSVIGLKTSDVNFKGNKWILNKDGDSRNKVIVNKSLDSITIQEIVMNNEVEEQIRLRGQLADSTYKDLQLQFKIVSLEKITPAIDSLHLEGEVNGILNILQKDNIYLPSSNLGVSDFSVNGMRLGDLTMGIVGNRDLTEFTVNTQITNNGVESLGVFGKINNRGEVPEADLMANLTNFRLEPFSPLGEGVITNIRGLVNGSARIRGEAPNPEISGLLTLDQAGLSIPELNVDYAYAPYSRVNLYGQTFDFDKIAVKDVAMNTKATLNGTISHDHFDVWNLDLHVDTKEDRLLVLNTEFTEESLYYGTAFIRGEGRIYGPTNALTIKVIGDSAEGSSLKIPLSDVATVGDYSFIDFVEKGETIELESERVLDEYEGLELDFDLNITPDAELEIITDRKTGSTLRGTGAGLVLLRINTLGKFEMYGDFVVVNGEYNYRFGGIIDKTFRVEPGGTIVWNRDPLKAEIDMKAIYSLNANPTPLLDNGSTRRIPTNVVIQLSDELENPTIGFDIEFPGTNSIVKSELEYRLQDPTIEEKNAIFLLAQGTFVNAQTGISSQAITGEILQTAVGGLNQMLGGDNDKFNLGLNYEKAAYDPDNVLETDDRIGVTLSTKINDRLLFNGKVGVPVGGNESYVAGDFELQWLLNEEGSLSAKFFNRESEIQELSTDRQGYTQGMGISYEVDFNSFGELFRRLLTSRSKQAEPPVVKREVSQPDGQSGDPRSISFTRKDSLIQFQPKEKK